MYAYMLTQVPEGQPRWFATQGDAQTAGKNSPLMMQTHLLCVDIDIDKRGIVALLNRDDTYTKVLRTWIFTRRGGLTEITGAEMNEPVALSVEPTQPAPVAIRRAPAAPAPFNPTKWRDEVADDEEEAAWKTDPAVAPPGVDQAEYDRTRAEINARDAKFRGKHYQDEDRSPKR